MGPSRIQRKIIYCHPHRPPNTRAFRLRLEANECNMRENGIDFPRRRNYIVNYNIHGISNKSQSQGARRALLRLNLKVISIPFCWKCKNVISQFAQRRNLHLLGIEYTRILVHSVSWTLHGNIKAMTYKTINNATNMHK